MPRLGAAGTGLPLAVDGPWEMPKIYADLIRSSELRWDPDVGMTVRGVSSRPRQNHSRER